ncbi:hypothetical protein H6G54_23970 [Anabaena cylindrica FACHB-243]|uniref:Uncharacterized protein n=1 Tax=Anabaena cylindrica (strain ATCC 27899 / PCC 7122) TaxID=272123 RepID=K9ZI88_ANACC|nr:MULTISPECIES: hypothetical protein [Anabaena]AFZ58948.1 hypothetical protein Anacy_3553 [Anabaena cylindrica PCC 7122]MBD2420707.1 hypothetical protein [Anabaena cylindrica FACHB-243]MBY5284401.1 hypothetical protein [Anabaena sp. CCAP 1446/1C]MBY5306688.1 hypothetical protein [Anabaena sp. CCAP 1446/1C]MCM2408399.1 hypothetical protein [Anabaena sp. CCAP 1446/1C]
MRLPFILDVALGLIFIYLILSLLAAEIQELMATVLQWRAIHLKKSIEILLAGDVSNSQAKDVIELVNKIYSNPLIKSINQEAKGFFSVLPRKLTWLIADITRPIRKLLSKSPQGEKTFDQSHSGPSYIGGDTFAATLIEELQLPKIIHSLTEVRLEKFKTQRLQEVETILTRSLRQIELTELSNHITQDINDDFENLKSEYTNIVADFKDHKIDIDTSVNRMKESLEKYIDNFQANIDNENKVLIETLLRLQAFCKHTFANTEEAIIVGGLKPNINEIVQLMNTSNAVYKEMKTAFQGGDNQTYQTINQFVDGLPPAIRENIETIAKRAQYRAKSTEEGIQLLRREIENSFDSSMQRAGGVYKRNAKGVAILLGIVLAFGANADTFHIIDRLSKDTVLRETIVYKAEKIIDQQSGSTNLDNINTTQILEDVNFPIGWTDDNLKEQLERKAVKINGWPVINVLRMTFGWLISGLAIAMGAPFWFDLLSKVMNVRNAGKSPKSS